MLKAMSTADHNADAPVYERSGPHLCIDGAGGFDDTTDGASTELVAWDCNTNLKMRLVVCVEFGWTLLGQRMRSCVRAANGRREQVSKEVKGCSKCA